MRTKLHAVNQLNVTLISSILLFTHSCAVTDVVKKSDKQLNIFKTCTGLKYFKNVPKVITVTLNFSVLYQKVCFVCYIDITNRIFACVINMNGMLRRCFYRNSFTSS